MMSQFISFLNFIWRLCRHKRGGDGAFFIVFIVIIFVFMPCLFKPISCFAREEIFEVPHSNFVGQKEISKQFVDGVFSLVNIQQDIIKGMPEFLGSRVKGYDFMNLPFSAFGKEMISNSSHENAEKNIKSFLDKTGNPHLVLDPILWIGFSFVILYSVTYICIELFGVFYT